MPTDEYTSTLGGALKLKGSKISKRSHHHNKKKRPKPLPPKQPAEDEQHQQQDDDRPLSKRRLLAVANDNGKWKQNEDRLEEERVEEDEGRDDAVELEDGLLDAAMHTERGKKGVWAVGKTEAERRHEEQRRKRVSPFFFFQKKKKTLERLIRPPKIKQKIAR